MNRIQIVANQLSSPKPPNPDNHISVNLQHHYTEVTLDRAKQMNTFTISMAKKMQGIIKKLNDIPHMKLALLRKNEGPAFCAGGDLKSIMKESSTGEHNYQYEINKVVYLMSQAKPTYVAFLDGIVMGTGVGLSFFAKIKIATENTLLAMPESKLGYITDVGAGWYLPRLNDGVGLYMMLTGTGIKGEDLVKVGLAHYYVESDKLEDLRRELKEHVVQMRIERISESSLRKIVEKYSKKITGEFSLKSFTKEHFEGKTSVEEVIKSLKGKIDSDTMAKKILDTLNANSPISLKANFELHEKGKKMTLEEVLKLELNVGPKLMAQGDIIRGVQRVLLKQESEWAHKTVEEVTREEIEELFKVEKFFEF